MTASPSRRDRIAGGLVGLLVGDALGVPYEFHQPETIPAADLLEYGLTAIPERWVTNLRGRDVLAPLQAALLTRAA